jgi:hypothetical protein
LQNVRRDEDLMQAAAVHKAAMVPFPAKRTRGGTLVTDALARLCADLGVRIIPVSVRRHAFETTAGPTLQRLLDDHGAGHLCIVLRCIVESTGNETELRSETIWAISDIVLARPDWVDRGLDLLEAFDAIDLKALRLRAKGILPRHIARVVLGVLLWARLRVALGEDAPDCVRVPPPPGLQEVRDIP